jgi:hypothetical protein
MEEPIYPVDLRLTIMGREPWELMAIVGVGFVANLFSREWAGILLSIPIGIGAAIVVSVVLKRVRQLIPLPQLRLLWEWLITRDVYIAGREEVCKPVILEGVSRRCSRTNPNPVVPSPTPHPQGGNA